MRVLTTAGRYVDAARHMTPRQILARPRRIIPPRWLAAGRDPETLPWRPAAVGLGVDPAPQSGHLPPPELDGIFRAVGRERAFASEAFWTDDSDGLLFLFHLHAFADLARYCAGTRTHAGDAFWASVLRGWLEECDTPARPAWHPFPTSGRIIAWSAALSTHPWSPDLAEALRASLARQLRMLRRSVEYDIGGNHVLRNATALIVGGICMQEGRSEEAGLSLLERELGRQILRDGGHEERSTSYHREVLTDLGDVIAVLRQASRPLPGWLTTSSAAMEGWLAALAGPDGRVPLLNDAWEGPPVAVGPRPDAVDLDDSGYVVLRSGRDQAVLDVGPVAPSHLPPHAHADVLSFVLWADGRLIVADPGAFSYSGDDRLRFRGTAAHSTVQVDEQDQCDLWGPFRAAGMPRVRRGALEQAGDARVITAEHDGYRRLPDPVTHRRTFCWLPGDGLVVLDKLLAGGTHRVSTRIHLAPGVHAGPGRAGPLEVRALGPGMSPVVEAGSYSPFLGREVAASTIRRDLVCPPGATFGWAIVRPGVVVTLSGERLRIERSGHEPFELASQ